MKSVVRFFDRLEDRVRYHLSHYPILYALIGAIGIVLVWKGIWEVAELFPVLHGPGSVVLGLAILLLTGLMVSFFIGDKIILSGYRQEKKLAEKTEAEVKAEERKIDVLLTEVRKIEHDIESIKEKEGM